MTTLDASLSAAGFDMSDGTLVNFNAYLNSDSIHYSWETSVNTAGDPIDYIHAFGTGITTDGSNYPTGGSITSLKIDLNHDGNPNTDENIDAQISLTSPVALTSLVSPSGTDPDLAADRFWSALLSGNDTIYAPGAARSLVFGDFLKIHSSQTVNDVRTGGDDVISAVATGDSSVVSLGGRGGVSALVGDAYLVSGETINTIAYVGQLDGGDDTITLSGLAGYTLVGDAFDVEELGSVHGGNDTLKSDATVDTFNGFGPIPILAGDVVDNNGFVTGGNDTITGSNSAFLDETIAGDVWRESGASTGGRDNIHGRAGHDYIAGDTVIAAGAMTGGEDKIYGGEDADIISGDALQAGNEGPFGHLRYGGGVKVTIAGGNDAIQGDQGNDILAGDIYAFGQITGGSSIAGGNDVLNGGDGDDTLYGDWGPGVVLATQHFFDHGGNDTLIGGPGKDAQYGESGNDVFIVAAGSDSVNEVIDGGDGTDRIRFTSVTPHDTLVLSHHVARVEIAEIADAHGKSNGTTPLNLNASAVGYGMSLRGNGGANTLTGTAFDDGLTGNGGKDTLIGGDGHDHFVYKHAADSTSTHYDTVDGADFKGDKFDVPGSIGAIDHKIGTGTLSTAHFDHDLAAAVTAAHLQAHHAVLFTPHAGTLKGSTFLVVDLNGRAGYQADADLVVQLTHVQHLAALNSADFI